MAAEWYVAKVKAQTDHLVEEWLAQRGVPTLAPRIWVARRSRKGYEPLFPGYVFCWVDPWSEARPLMRWGRGIQYLLPQGHEPLPVSDGLIDAIRQRVSRWNQGGWRQAFLPGNQVVLRRGPFRGLNALFRSYLPPRERCRVLISLLGRPHEIEIETEDLEVGWGEASLDPASA